VLGRLWGAMGVFEMFSYRGGVVNQFLIGWGMYELSRQNVPWLYIETGIALQLLGV